MRTEKSRFAILSEAAPNFCTGFDKYLEEANAGKGICLPRTLKPLLQFVLPILIVVIIVQGLI